MTHAVLTQPPARWPESWREAFEERAAIKEHHGALARHVAEQQAAADLRSLYAQRARERRRRTG